MFSPRLTVSMPCYGRPERTIRAIECIANQESYNFEALVTGDGCSIMQKFITSMYFLDLQERVEKRGSKLIIRNNKEHKGGSGYAITNQHIKEAKGEYFIFFANDDVILENHFEHYLSHIEGKGLDFVYFDTFLNMYQKPRISSLKYGHIGHSELIVRTRLLKNMPEHERQYGHDWTLIENLTKATSKHKKADSNMTTYYIMSLPNNREQNID